MLPRPELICPRCQQPNRCAPARSGSFDTPCWCRDVVIDPAVINALPEAQRNRCCLCRECATAAADAPAPASRS